MRKSMQQEIARIREINRSLKAEVQMLRQDMEEGKIRIRVSHNENFRLSCAKALVEEFHPGYHSCGFHYADPVEEKIYYFENQASSWEMPSSFRIVRVTELFNEGCDYSPEVDWKVVEIPDYEQMVNSYIAVEKEEPSKRSHVVNFAREACDKWANILDGIEEDALDAAISFALCEMKDEIVISLTSYS